MKEWDFYQIAGVIAPGMTVVVGGVLLLFPEMQQGMQSLANISVGGLGIGLIAAYVVGQLLQGVGNLLEQFWWKLWGGMPTDWVRSGKRKLICDAQMAELNRRLQIALNDGQFSLAKCDTDQWRAVTRQVHAGLVAGKVTDRTHTFNSNYGLCRGIAAAFLILLIATLIVDYHNWQVAVLLAGLLSLSIYRMHRFGVHYGQELFAQYLANPATSAKQEA